MTDGVSEPYTRQEKHFYDVRPLVRALQTIANAGRARRESGIEDEAVKYARLAFAAIEYAKADDRNDLDQCGRLMEQIWSWRL